MNKIVRAHFPVEKLPQELRVGLDLTRKATITVELEENGSSDSPMSFLDIFAAREPPFRKKEEIDDDLRADREEWGR
ncbi:hypothetical protein [Methylocystis bryophila]|uniref:Uncharacterized protein n=1 Tax=Methylocystis bryophila TaxID=655015 RepID=A0A1W6MVL0_9HYPH|nr:hypothetical protein [Methylocystis bryophila]ARN81643.1 hypothetical protein B1812_11800 [Methylocystis bryophila]BDV37686.1 hypothetical protein DSM21852_09390 [Methylocystis bryophila]